MGVMPGSHTASLRARGALESSHLESVSDPLIIITHILMRGWIHWWHWEGRRQMEEGCSPYQTPCFGEYFQVLLPGSSVKALDAEGLSSRAGHCTPQINNSKLALSTLQCICYRGEENRNKIWFLEKLIELQWDVFQMGNLHAGQCFSLNTGLFSSNHLLSLTWYL